MIWRAITWLTLAIGLSGCAALPSFGPTAAAVERAAVGTVDKGDDVLPFRIVNVSRGTLPDRATHAGLFPQQLRRQTLRARDDVIAVGDRLDIRIWEVAEDGLFAAAGRRETSLPVVVSNSGTISAPYAGTLRAQGLTVEQLRAALLGRYRGQAVEPEIAVTITETQSTFATILGAVEIPGRATIPSRGVRLLDFLAQAGGTRLDAWEAAVTLRRGAARATVRLTDILDRDANNIIVLPGDIIDVAHRPRRFAVYGAVNRPGNITIPLKRATLSYLLAEVGGLNDGVAQAKSVFVFRPAATGDAMATAYRFDFTQPDAFLLAGRFTVLPTDITYVTAAEVVDFQRLLATVLAPVLGTATVASNLSN